MALPFLMTASASDPLRPQSSARSPPYRLDNSVHGRVQVATRPCWAIIRCTTLADSDRTRVRLLRHFSPGMAFRYPLIPPRRACLDATLDADRKFAGGHPAGSIAGRSGVRSGCISPGPTRGLGADQHDAQRLIKRKHEDPFAMLGDSRAADGQIGFAAAGWPKSKVVPRSNRRRTNRPTPSRRWRPVRWNTVRCSRDQTQKIRTRRGDGIVIATRT